MTTIQGYTISQAVTLVTEECCSCGAVFAMTDSFRQQCLDNPGPNGKRFYCPSGHAQWYTGETEAEKERKKRLLVEQRLESERGWSARLSGDLEAERKSHASTKGQLTKTRKRIQGGVCPCCNRHFTNMERHMAGEHPLYAVTP